MEIAADQPKPHTGLRLFFQALCHGVALALLTVAVLVILKIGKVSAVPSAAAEVPADAAGPIQAAVVPEPPDPQAVENQALTEFLARRYRIGLERVGMVVAAAREAAQEVKLDPLLILAVIGVESSFNPLALSTAGARGLMQIIPYYHLDKLSQFGGEESVHEEEANIMVGARILREYIRTSGGLQAGLQRYNGSSWDDSAEYTQKVLAEQARLREALERRLKAGISPRHPTARAAETADPAPAPRA